MCLINDIVLLHLADALIKLLLKIVIECVQLEVSLLDTDLSLGIDPCAKLVKEPQLVLLQRSLSYHEIIVKILSLKLNYRLQRNSKCSIIVVVFLSRRQW